MLFCYLRVVEEDYVLPHGVVDRLNYLREPERESGFRAAFLFEQAKASSKIFARVALRRP